MAVKKFTETSVKVSSSSKTALEQKLNKRLEGGQFRLLNEKMYDNKDLTVEQVKKYHELYKNQIKKWPVDPFEMAVKEIEELVDKENKIKVADVGCGDISKYTDRDLLKKCDFIFYDKYPLSEKVIEANLNDLPAEDASFDVVVSCLAFMMSDITAEIKQVNRILKTGGIFIFTEVTSRLKSIHSFVSKLEKFGFKTENVNSSNKYFVVIRMKKIENITETKKKLFLQKCKYKKDKQNK